MLITWMGSPMDEDWYNPMNWDMEQVPTEYDDVVIDSPFPCSSYGGAAVCKSLTVNSGYCGFTTNPTIVKGNLTVNGGRIYFLQGDVTVEGNFIINSGGICDLPLKTSGVSLTIGGDADFAGATETDKSDIRFNGSAGTQQFTTRGKTFKHIELQGGAALVQVGNLSCVELVLGNLGGAGMWDSNGYNMNVTDYVSVAGGKTLQLSTGTHVLGNSAGSWLEVFNTGIVSASGATLTLGGLLTVNSGATFTAPSGLMTIGSNVTINSGATFNHSNGTIKLLGDQSFQTSGKNVYNVVVDAAAKTVWFDGVTNVLNDVTMTTGSIECISGAVSIGRDLILNGAGTFKAYSGTVTIGRNFTKGTGGFNHNNGTVVFANAALTSVISGSPTFKNLTFGASKTHNFTAGQTFTVAGTLASNGGTSTKSVLRSTTTGVKWNLNAAGTPTLTDKVDVKDCDASSGSPISAIGSTDSGGNTNWTFSASDDDPRPRMIACHILQMDA